MQGFNRWAISSVTIVLPRSAINSDLTDIYLNKNLQDYIYKFKKQFIQVETLKSDHFTNLIKEGITGILCSISEVELTAQIIVLMHC